MLFFESQQEVWCDVKCVMRKVGGEIGIRSSSNPDVTEIATTKTQEIRNIHSQILKTYANIDHRGKPNLGSCVHLHDSFPDLGNTFIRVII